MKSFFSLIFVVLFSVPALLLSGCGPGGTTANANTETALSGTWAGVDVMDSNSYTLNAAFSSIFLDPYQNIWVASGGPHPALYIVDSSTNSITKIPGGAGSIANVVTFYKNSGALYEISSMSAISVGGSPVAGPGGAAISNGLFYIPYTGSTSQITSANFQTVPLLSGGPNGVRGYAVTSGSLSSGFYGVANNPSGAINPANQLFTVSYNPNLSPPFNASSPVFVPTPGSVNSVPSIDPSGNVWATETIGTPPTNSNLLEFDSAMHPLLSIAIPNSTGDLGATPFIAPNGNVWIPKQSPNTMTVYNPVSQHFDLFNDPSIGDLNYATNIDFTSQGNAVYSNTNNLFSEMSPSGTVMTGSGYGFDVNGTSISCNPYSYLIDSHSYLWTICTEGNVTYLLKAHIQ